MKKVDVYKISLCNLRPLAVPCVKIDELGHQKDKLIDNEQTKAAYSCCATMSDEVGKQDIMLLPEKTSQLLLACAVRRGHAVRSEITKT